MYGPDVGQHMFRWNAKACVHLVPQSCGALFSRAANEERAYASACGRLQEKVLHPVPFVTELIFLCADAPSC